jgi:exo-1,4-beta-D-glucosaminidase
MFDYYMKPNSATFATQKACAKTLHVSYNYADASVWINNESYRSYRNYTVSAQVYNLDLTRKYASEVAVGAIAANTSLPALTIGNVPGLSPTYFIRLQLKNASGTVMDDNLYWYSTQTDAFNFANHSNDGCEVARYADLTGLNSLPTNYDVAISGSKTASNGMETTTINLQNISGSNLAFFLRPEVTKGRDGREVVPVYYDDGYITLWPGESKTITAKYATADLQAQTAYLRLSGFHVTQKLSPISLRQEAKKHTRM